ncbi:MAG: DUF805 domain-containing protein [Candidatus Dactylopiibacterium sp.]|nr:DUF805 domain-containing protein [Candidatus Dactylopiibacterium sp.]
MRFRITFRGELLPGADPAAAREHARQMLGLDAARLDAFFSGRLVVLKRGLDAAALAPYLERLSAAGLSVQAEAETEAGAASPAAPAAVREPATPLPPPPAAQTPGPVTPAADAPPPPPDDITCPRCGERQPRRTLCRGCALDIPRYLAAQAGIDAERRAEANAAREAALIERGLRPLPHDDEARVALLGFSFHGRMRRRTYLLAGALQFCVLLLALHFLLFVATHVASAPLLIALLVIGTPAVLVWSLRLVALRCHDLGWSGWCSLLVLVPVVNLAAWLVLLLLPGQKHDNDYGPRPPPTPWLFAIAGVVVSIVLGIVSNQRLNTPDNGLVQVMRDAPATPAAPAGRYAAHNRVVMYSLTTCPWCREKREQLTAAGVPFTELFLDTDVAAMRAFEARLREAGHRGGVGTPSFEINGELLLNNPPLDVVLARLAP